MRRTWAGVLASVLFLACGGDEITDPFAGGFDAAGGHGGSAGSGSGGRGTGGSAGKGTTGGSAGVGTGGSGGARDAGDASTPDVATSDAADGGPADVSADASDGADRGTVDAPLDISMGGDAPADVVAQDRRGDEPGCGGPNDCPAPTNECLVATCVDGGCGTAPKALGVATTGQVAGDCKRKVCDGNGGTTNQNDDNDVSNDNNVCTLDGCSNGTPTHVPQTGMNCGTNGVCSAGGACVGCNAAADCPGTDDFCKTRKCDNGMCGFTFTGQGMALPANQQTTGDCITKACDGNGGVEDDPAPNDIVPDSNPCTKDLCNGTTPTHPPENAGTVCSVGNGHKCDGAGSCVECLAPADCATPAGFPCTTATCNGSHQCATASAPPTTNCGQGPSCSSDVAHAQDKCNGSGACVSGANTPCPPYVCAATTCRNDCTNDNDCSGTGVCDVGTHQCVLPTDPKCSDYCTTIVGACTGSNEQYQTADQCLHTCADMRRTDAVSTNTVACRLSHAGFAATVDAVTHCPHAGPAGDGVCGANCESFCSLAASACTGGNQQYATLSDCTNACNNFTMTPPRYTSASVTGNTFGCRMFHLTLATIDPVTHCPHIAVNSATCQ
jgi:hypothetical protein